jgi:hypothetical protein
MRGRGGWHQGNGASTQEHLFIAANDALLARARELEIGAQVPFLCECGDSTCTAIVPMTVEKYVELRSDPSARVSWLGH